MTISYKKLWKMLIDKDMKKKDLMRVAKLNTSIVAKMGKDLPVNLEVMSRICKALECDIGDVMEMIPDEK